MNGTNQLYTPEPGFNIAEFLPKCVRNSLQEMKNKDNLRLPFSKQIKAVVMTCEISGIQDCIDLYSISNTHCVITFVDQLNHHISGIMKKVIAENGDIIHLENGYIECIWPTENENICHLYRIVLDTALAIQREFGASKPRLGSQIQDKICVSVGDVEVMLIGSENCFYMIAGDVLKEVRELFSVCGTEGIVVTNTFWNDVRMKYKYEWKESGKNYVTVISGHFQEAHAILTSTYVPLNFSSKNITEEIYKFLHPFYKRAKTKQQLQTLTSLSQVVFVVVRAVDFDVSCVDRFHSAINKINAIVQIYEGIITKIIYQKDPTVCIVFGLPGFKHTDDAVRSILCAQNILKCASDFQMKASIGISSGIVSCDILGATPRQECCVLGMPVYTALSIVHKIQSREIVCDVNVYFRSFRSFGDIFTLFRIRLKDLKTSRLFFEIRSLTANKDSPNIKCIGRKKEKEFILNALKELKKNIKHLKNSVPLINITGELGVGKSTLLNWTLQEAKKLGYGLIAHVSTNKFQKPNRNAWSILRQVLACCSADSESKILDMLKPDPYRYPLHLLNGEISTSFRKREGDETVLEMMVELIKRSANDKCVLIAVDNAEYTGTETWLFLQRLLAHRVAVVLTSFNSQFKCTIPLINKIFGEKYLGVHLETVTGSEFSTLACHILDVGALHKELLDFFQNQSNGNTLHLQEILMLPQLQKHYYLVPFSSIPENILKERFVFADDEEEKIDYLTSKVCDIVDPKSLPFLKIPNLLLDIVKDRTTSLNPDEQLLRKFSLLGETFGLRIIEMFCPDYSSDELREKLQCLVDKNILVPSCKHWKVTAMERSRKLSLGEVAHRYCVHPLRFASDFLKRSIHNSLADNQRLHLYLADLLREETNNTCDSCRKERGRNNKQIIQCQAFFKKYKTPSVDLRLCQCLSLQTDILIEVEFHLEKGNAPMLPRRINTLLDAAQKGLDARLFAKVEEILDKIQSLNISHEDQNEPDYVKTAIKRLQAAINISMGNIDEALRNLKKATLNMNIQFPDDIESGIYKSKKFKGYLGSEEYRCLCLGCYILISLGLYDKAARVGSLLEKFLLQENEENIEVVNARILYLKAITKTQRRKYREKTSARLISAIHQQCFRRLSESPVVTVEELLTILKASGALVQILFETNKLDACRDLGCKTFELLKMLNHPRLLVEILFWLTLIHLSERNYKKCLEMMSHLQDAYQQSGDLVSELTYQTLLIKLMRETNILTQNKDLVEICMKFAAQGNDFDSLHPKHSSKIYCLRSSMALWCMEQDLKVPFPMWYNQAQKLQADVRLNNYWSLLGTIYLEIINILKKQDKFFVLTKSELVDFKKSFEKVIENIQNQIKNFVPVLGKCCTEIETRLRNAIKQCQRLNK